MKIFKGTDAAHAFSQLGVRARQEKAYARRVRVAELKAQGMTGPQIQAFLKAEGTEVKLRTIHNDFSILKKEKGD